MKQFDWSRLLQDITIDTSMSELSPVPFSQVEQFEKDYSVYLPESYRQFCTVFGAGELADRFAISVPGYKGPGDSTYSLQELQNLAHEEQEEDAYSPDPKQHKRGIFFCCDIINAFHFFDPAEVSDANGNECAVFTVFRDYRTQRTADNFWLFVTECCIGDKWQTLIKGNPPAQRFTPVG